MKSLLLLALAADPAVWWQTYADPELTRLIEKVTTGNLDLRAAGFRIAEARAVTGMSRSRLAPAINTSTSIQRLRGGFAQGVTRIPDSPGAAGPGGFVTPFETSLGQGAADMRWELDLFGANRAAVSAAQADAIAEEQRRADLRITLTAEAARAYMELRGVEERIAIVQSNARLQRERLNLTAERARAGLESQLDVERQVVLLANTEARLPDLERARAVRLHRLAALTGDSAYTVAPSSALITVPDASRDIPLELLRRRPDVRAAEAQVAAATARRKQARSDLYPKITLSGAMGRQATSFGGLTLGGGNFFQFGPSLQLPLFNFGRIRSNIAASEARLDQHLLAVENEVLLAVEEANNALESLRRSREREAALAGAVTAAQSAVELASDLQRAGLGDFLSVLDAQRSALDAEFDRSSARTQSLVESVQLFKALAGGWPQ